ncbi:MAG: methenyltetrahydromethanopterin cyclohydrolase [Candidatus Bathyarchaeia archaeon]
MSFMDKMLKRWEKVSINQRSLDIVKEMIKNSDRLNVAVEELKNGTTILDCGVNVSGGYKAGELTTKIAFGGFGEAQVTAVTYDDLTLPVLIHYTDFPPFIALSMYVWVGVIPPPHVGTKKFTAWISGPAKAIAQEPAKIFEKWPYKDPHPDNAVLLVQTRSRIDGLPDEEFSKIIAKRCRIDPKNLYLVVIPTDSITGTTQTSSRGVEDMFWRLTEYYKIPYRRIENVMGTTPISPVSPKALQEPCSWPDDMIRYGGTVHCWVRSEEGEDFGTMVKESVIENYPNTFGTSFYHMAVEEKKYIDPTLDLHKLAKEGLGFIIGEFAISDTRTGRMHKAGRVHKDIIGRLMSNPW